VEFGRKIRLDEVEGGLITGYAVLEHAGGQDQPYLGDALANHRRQFGRAPHLLAADRGMASAAHGRLGKEGGGGPTPPPAVGEGRRRRRKGWRKGGGSSTWHCRTWARRRRGGGRRSAAGDSSGGTGSVRGSRVGSTSCGVITGGSDAGTAGSGAAGGGSGGGS